MPLLELKRSKSVADDSKDAGTRPAPKKSAKPFVASMATVNLLSPEALEVVELRRIRRLFVLIGIGVVAAIVVGYIAQAAVIASANHDREAEESRGQTLAGQLTALTPVKAYYGAIEQNQLTIQQTMSGEVLTSLVFEALQAFGERSDVSLSNTGLTVNSGGGGAPAAAGAATSVCPNPDPFNPSSANAGCVTVDGTASSRAAIGEWIDTLQQNPMFADVFVPTATADPSGKVTFTATIGLSEEVYAHRYDDLDFLKNGAK